MAKPLIYICYGMPKSGSTLAFNLTRAVLEDAGITQGPLDAPEAVKPGVMNYIDVIRPNELAALCDAADTLDETPIAIKTHGGLWGCVERALTAGWARGQAVCRDPREVALSMLDAAREDRTWGKRNGIPMLTLQDALPAVRAHIDKFDTWAAHPNVMTLTYDELAFDTVIAASKIAAHLDVTVNETQCARAALSMLGQFNRGIEQRWRQEMSKDDIARFADEFGDFIEAHGFGREAASKGGLLTKLKGRLKRGDR